MSGADGDAQRVEHLADVVRVHAVELEADGSPAVDRLGVVLRDWSSALLGADARTVAEGYCTVLAEHTGVDAQRIWEWGFLERVSTGLYLLDVVRGPDRVARPYLESAERLVD